MPGPELRVVPDPPPIKHAGAKGWGCVLSVLGFCLGVWAVFVAFLMRFLR